MYSTAAKRRSLLVRLMLTTAALPVFSLLLSTTDTLVQLPTLATTGHCSFSVSCLLLLVLLPDCACRLLRQWRGVPDCPGSVPSLALLQQGYAQKGAYLPRKP